MSTFTSKERERFRKLLEVAHSSTFTGERDAALAAATRLAESHDMTLREAAGMTEEKEAEKPRPFRSAGFPGDYGARMDDFADAMGRRRPQPGFHRSEAERLAAEKKRHQEAMADAYRRGLDAEERSKEAKRAATLHRSSPGRWRARPEFIRVLLRETSMSAREIAATAGVTIYDVFREKLLMRRGRAA